MIPTCTSAVAGAVGVVTLLGFGVLWIASGLPESVEATLALIVGAVAAFVAAPGVGVGVNEVLLYSVAVGGVVAAFVGEWRPQQMLARSATYAIAFAGILSFLGPFVVRAPTMQPTGMGPTFHYIVGSISRAMASGFTSLAVLLPGVGC